MVAKNSSNDDEIQNTIGKRIKEGTHSDIKTNQFVFNYAPDNNCLTCLHF